MFDQFAQQYLSSQDSQVAINLVRQFRTNGFHHLGSLLGKFFAKRFPHSYDIKDELGMNLFYSNNHEKSYDMYTSVLKLRGLDQSLSQRILHNRHFSVEHIKNRYAEYDSDLVKTINKRKHQPLPLVTLTITSCKRIDLFVPTVNSFIRCCKDWELIDEWICVDDNSSEEDRKKMVELFPFFTFIFKTPEQKGHPQSLNILQQKVHTPYVLHLEDDWLFVEEKKYITEALEIMGENDKILQVLFNKNYAETAGDVSIKGGEFHTTKKGNRYYIHQWVRNDEEMQIWLKQHCQGGSSNYWPHFSFRPSLFKKRIWDEFGPFNETVSHFEMEYSHKYANAGYVSAFFEGVYCLHTGRLTSERNDHTKLNAYDLNGEAQFTGKEEQAKQKEQVAPVQVLETTASGTHFTRGRQLPAIIKHIEPISLANFDRKIETFVVNLDRRPDRWEAFKRKAVELQFLNYQRFSAVDGKKLVPTEQLQYIFENNDYNMRKGMVGCALSHLQLYVNMMNDQNSDIYCILEDDIEFAPDFQFKLLHIYNLLRNHNWDMVYLGHHVYDQYLTPDTYNGSKMPRVEIWDRRRSLTESIGGTGGYLITRQGALKLLEFINSTGMTNGIDTVQQKSADTLNIYYAMPHLIYSECWRGDNNPDTDIQYDYDSLTIPMAVRIQKVLNYYGVIDVVIDETEALSRCTSKDLDKPFCYNSDNMNQIKGQTIYPYYQIGQRCLIVDPTTEEFHRFKKNGVWSLEHVIAYEEA